jgi:hypothetical protein
MKPVIKHQINTFFFFAALLFTSLCSYAQQVSRVEYFFDADPGFGKATNVALAAGADVTVNFQVNINSLTPGFHRLFTRAFVAPYKDSAAGPVKGGWSLTGQRLFYKEDLSGSAVTLPNIVKGEYYLDIDPGFGKGINIPLTPGTDIGDIAFAVDITSMQTGFHRLHTRFRDANGVWGQTTNRSFYKEDLSTKPNELPNIVKGEFFVDTDPGFGKGSNIAFTPGKDLSNISFVADISKLSGGFHRLYTRFMDSSGAWSLTNNRSFYTEESTVVDTTLPNIVQGEYFLDTDPGFGRGKSISFTPGKNVTNISFTADVSGLTQGFHRLYTRFKNAEGQWSLTNVRSFYKETFGGPEPVAIITGIEYFIDADPGFGKGKNVPLTPGFDISDLMFEVDMTDVTIGNHQLYVRAKDSSGAWSLTNMGTFKVEADTALVITVGTFEKNICAGATVKVPFKVNAAFGSNNKFTAQLSNSSGSFSNPVNIGTLAGRNTDTINAVIPANTPAGNAYRIRIIANSPTDTSAANTGNITINRVPEEGFNITGKNKVCLSAETYSMSNAVSNVTKYLWVLSPAAGSTLDTSGGTVTVQWKAAGTYTLQLTTANACRCIGRDHCIDGIGVTTS